MVTSNLPGQSTPFIGRTEELAQIRQLLADPECRLLTLLGPGGIGKTRLAMEAAAQHGLYRVNAQRLKPIHDWVTPFERYWSESYDRLDDVLQTLQEKRK